MAEAETVIRGVAIMHIRPGDACELVLDPRSGTGRMRLAGGVPAHPEALRDRLLTYPGGVVPLPVPRAVTHFDDEADMPRYEKPPKTDLDLLELAHGVISAVGLHQGGWEQQHQEWVNEAIRWREAWHARLKAEYVVEAAPSADVAAMEAEHGRVVLWVLDAIESRRPFLGGVVPAPAVYRALLDQVEELDRATGRGQPVEERRAAAGWLRNLVAVWLTAEQVEALRAGNPVSDA